MHIRSLRQALVENLIDLISIKSGLMISEFKAFDFLSEILPGWWQGDKKEIIRIEVGEFEDAFIHLMYKVGAIQNKEDLTDVVISYVKNNYQQLCLDPTNVMEVYKTVNDLKIHLLENTLQNKTFPEKFLQLPHLEILIRDFKDRYIMHNEMPDSVNWNGIIPLNTLFEEERTDVVLVGFDLADETKQMLQNPEYHAVTVLQKQDQMGYLGMLSLNSLIKGEKSEQKYFDTGVIMVDSDYLMENAVS